MAPVTGFDSFCERCKVLALDDADQGGFESISIYDGELELKFDKKDHLRTLELEFNLEDRYPDLPTLSESSAKGCQSCDFIKAAILWENSKKHIEDLIGIDS